MSMHFVVRFEPKPGCEAAFRLALTRLVGPSRAEAGCRRFQVFESLQEPMVFAVHSEWVDEAAFERHASLSDTVNFIAAARELLTHEVRGLRLRSWSEIA